MRKIPLFGIIIAILFIILGINLISKEDEFTVIVGYATIIFNSGVSSILSHEPSELTHTEPQVPADKPGLVDREG